MSRYIDADKLKAHYAWWGNNDTSATMKEVFDSIVGRQPTADVRENIKGEWLEKHHSYADEESPIEEWQSCKCSVCGRYDTRPYMYYFSEPHYCSWCGADMRGES